MKRGGVKREVSQRFTQFPKSIQAETCFADTFHWMKELKLSCHIMEANAIPQLLVSTFTQIWFWISWTKKKKLWVVMSPVLNHNGSWYCWYSRFWLVGSVGTMVPVQQIITYICNVLYKLTVYYSNIVEAHQHVPMSSCHLSRPVEAAKSMWTLRTVEEMSAGTLSYCITTLQKLNKIQ